ncbi:hypothetical protein V6N13_005762 [Hibiscus sabdariffa]|uniref:peptidylprolyl isomerase n=1 Tax=Hibiscus sabdariffa TaxID=183260 RepID=A0ABR2EQ86_9ROSI
MMGGSNRRKRININKEERQRAVETRKAVRKAEAVIFPRRNFFLFLDSHRPMASISAAGFLPQHLAFSAGTGRASSTMRPMACFSQQQQQEQQKSQLIERRKLMVIGSVGLLAPALWDSSNGDIGMAMAASSGFTDMPALRGKDYGKTKMRYPDYTETESGLQYKDLRVGDGPTPKMGETVVVDWDGYTIGYYGRIFEARNKSKGGSFVGDDKDFFKFRLGSQEVIPAFEEAVSGMALGGVRRIIVPPELGYPDNDYNKSGPKPTTFSGQRALDFRSSLPEQLETENTSREVFRCFKLLGVEVVHG